MERRQPQERELFARLSMYDIEQEIMKVWSTVDDVRVLRWAHLDREEPLTEDELANTLLGIETLLSLRCEHLFEVYSKLLKETK
jgi:hypothetical protein